MFILKTRCAQNVVLEGLRELYISKIYFCRPGAFVQYVPYKSFSQPTTLKTLNRLNLENKNFFSFINIQKHQLLSKYDLSWLNSAYLSSFPNKSL